MLVIFHKVQVLSIVILCLRIAVHLQNIDAKDFKVYSLSGADVSSEIQQLSNSNGELVLDISSLENGVYLIEFQSAGSTSVKFVKE